MVRSELPAAQQTLRDEAKASGAIPPIFLSEYVFFAPIGGAAPIALGIVCKAPCGGALEKDATIDVTEYLHTPIEGHFRTLWDFQAA